MRFSPAGTANWIGAEDGAKEEVGCDEGGALVGEKEMLGGADARGVGELLVVAVGDGV